VATIDYLCSQGESQWWPYKPLPLGGLWYSMPAAGECPKGQTPGKHGGCSWAATKITFVNETCMNSRVDAVVMQRNSECFAQCSTDDVACTQVCYFIALAGNKTAGLPPIALSTLESAWTSSFLSVEKGGCPEIPHHRVGVNDW
jgi:hypothetical protein